MKQNVNNRPLMVSLCDFTGKMVAPWLEHGIDAVIVDPQHAKTTDELMQSGAVLTRISAIIDSDEVYAFLRNNLQRIVFLAGFPRARTLLFPVRAGLHIRLTKIRFSSSKRCKSSGSVTTLQR